MWAELFHPLYRVISGALLPDGTAFRLINGFDGAEPVIGLSIALGNPAQTPVLLRSGAEALLLTSAGHAAEPVIILFSIVLAFGARTLRQAGVGLCYAIPACILIQAVTVPFLLVGAYYTKICADCIGPAAHLIWDGWLNLLENGGDWALTTVSAFLCVVVANRSDTH